MLQLNINLFNFTIHYITDIQLLNLFSKIENVTVPIFLPF